jgi:hypothetical protein
MRTIPYSQKHQIPFPAVEAGEVFEIHGILYIKTNIIYSGLNALNVVDGRGVLVDPHLTVQVFPKAALVLDYDK